MARSLRCRARGERDRLACPGAHRQDGARRISARGVCAGAASAAAMDVAAKARGRGAEPFHRAHGLCAADRLCGARGAAPCDQADRKSTRLNSSHEWISYAVFCLKKKKNK